MASGHCLLMDPLWYYAYRIGAATTFFQISVTIAHLDAAGSVASQETLYLSPAAQSAVNAARTVQVNLQGDLLSYTSAPTFSDKLLLMPIP